MKIFLLVVTVILLYYKVKNTASMVNEKVFMKELSSSKESVEKLLQEHSENEVILMRNCMIVIFALRALLYIQYYRLAGNYAGVEWFTVLSLLKMAIVVVLMLRTFEYLPSIMKGNFERIKFSLKGNLCTLVLDYSYYIMVLWFLVMVKK